MALYLKKLELKKVHRDIKPFSIEFRDGINVIVGENGAGKSSMFDLLMSQDDKFTKELREVTVDPVTYRFFDTEKENPRMKDPNLSNNFSFAIHSRFMSHGQAMIPILKAIDEFEDILLFIDEPEAGLSLSKQNEIFKAFKKAVKNGCQIVIATHSYVIINKSKEVFSLDHKKWMPSKEYLEGVLK